MINKSVILRNGVKMPMLGIGTFKSEDGIITEQAVKAALEIGYRHIDCAAIYGNEKSVGKGILESKVERKEIFITSKVWNSEQGYEKTIKAFQKTISELGVDYLDLYLIHWPKALNKETWKALEFLYKEGKVKAIGVSNFKEHHLKELMEEAEIMPMVNQVEFHPQLAQPELVEFCKENKIQIEAWGPLMQGQVFNIDLFKTLAEKYNKTISQIVLRWEIQKGVVTIPKSVKRDRIDENYRIFDFEITEEDMIKISSLETGVRIGPDPDEIKF